MPRVMDPDFRQGMQTSTSIGVAPTTKEVAATVGIPLTADILTPGHRVDIGIEASFDGGISWQPFGSARWESGPTAVDRQGNPIGPNIRAGIGTQRPNRVRLVVDTRSRLLCSGDLDTVE